MTQPVADLEPTPDAKPIEAPPTTKSVEEKAPEVPKPSLVRLFKNASVYGVGQFINSLIGLITSPILSYLLSRADFGLLGITRSVSGGLTSLYRLGLDGAASRFAVETEGDAELMRKTAGTLNTFMVGWLAFLTILQELLGPTLYDHFGDGLPYSIYGRFIAYGLVCDGLTALTQAIWGAQERAKRIVGLRLLSSLVGNALVFGLLLGTKLGVMGMYWAGAIGPTIMLQFYLRFSWGTYGFAWDPQIVKRALSFGLPMVVHLTSHWILDAADRLMIDKYMGREAVGLYTVAYGSVSTLITINLAINGAYVPQFHRVHGKPEFEGFVGRATTYFLFASALATLVFVSLAGTSIRIFYAEKFRDAAAFSQILCLAPFLQAFYLIFVNGLFWAKATKLIPVGTVLAGAVNIGLNAVLIPRYGAQGAAWATLAGYAALALLFRYTCSRVTRIPFERERLARALIPLGALTLAACAVDGVFPPLVELPIKIALVLAAAPLLVASKFVGEFERAWVRQRVAKLTAKLPGRRRAAPPPPPPAEA